MTLAHLSRYLSLYLPLSRSPCQRPERVSLSLPLSRCHCQWPDRISPALLQEPDRQEVVDTPDGKPNAEWLVFRRHQPYQEPLEKTRDWGPMFEPSFDEISLFHGSVKNAKRRDA